jgi:peptidoglycan/xylan/chitin deacetylase (PgdA/CDA1 family)
VSPLAGATRGAATLVVLAGAGPSVASIGPLRCALLPGLAGIVAGSHVALTYDDGPDPVSTPHFLALLRRHDVRATFFLLGRHAVRHPALVRAIVAEGHELGVHGWDHRCVALTAPGRLHDEVRRSREAIVDLAGVDVAWYRPPYGVLTTPALLAARRAGLRTVLWSAWGRDWERRASPDRVVHTVLRTLRPGGTVLLHDTDRTSAPGSWRVTLSASDRLLHLARQRSVTVGPLADHGL